MAIATTRKYLSKRNEFIVVCKMVKSEIGLYNKSGLFFEELDYCFEGLVNKLVFLYIARTMIEFL